MRRQLTGLALVVPLLALVAFAGPVAAKPGSARHRPPPPPPPGWVVDRVRFEPIDGTPLTVDGLGDYRGVVKVGRASSGVAVIDELGLDDYLGGLAEMPPRWPAEALKAQVVAARSFALYSMQTTQATAAHGVGADICATDACQVFAGMARERQDGDAAWSAAVKATAGQVLLYKGRPIMAEYSSSNGGQSVAGSWPYLRPVRDPDDALSPLHHWQTTIPLDTIAGAFPGTGTLIAADRVSENTIQLTWQAADGSTVQVPVSISDFRAKLDALPGPPGVPDFVPSMRFSMVTDQAARNAMLDGAGWGHGVGMSQYGALGKALRGMHAADILAAYYAGLRPVTLPPEQLPATIRVAIDLARPSAVVTAGRFRVLDGSGRPLAVVATGRWQVEPGPGHAVRVVPPAPQAAVPAIDAVAVEPGVPAPGAIVRLSYRLSTPAAVHVAVQPPTGPPVNLDAGLNEAGPHVVALPASPVVGPVAVLITADAGLNRAAVVPVGYEVTPRSRGGQLAAGVASEGDAGGARSGTGLMAAAVLMALTAGLTRLRRRLH